jgi:phosphate transport system substrate-binding protein
MQTIFVRIALLASALAVVGCGGDSEGEHAAERLEGRVAIDGSSTVYPISEAVAEEFRSVEPGIRVTIGVSGTGGGFKKFLVGDTDINDASRPIKAKEVESAASSGVEFIELPVSFDGISLVINPENDFVDYLTADELRRIWQPESTVQTWSDVRPEWPNRPIKLYGPGTDSGTFDYFTEAINGESQACRSDFTASEDDNVLVQGIAGDRDSLGFFGYAYYIENTERLKVVPIDGGDGPVIPSAETINNGRYQPLSRPLFVYVAKPSADKPAVERFIHFYLDHAAELAAEVGYVGLPEDVYRLARERFDGRVTGSVFSGRNTVGLDIADLLTGSS